MTRHDDNNGYGYTANVAADIAASRRKHDPKSNARSVQISPPKAPRARSRFAVVFEV